MLIVRFLDKVATVVVVFSGRTGRLADLLRGQAEKLPLSVSFSFFWLSSFREGAHAFFFRPFKIDPSSFFEVFWHLIPPLRSLSYFKSSWSLFFPW